MSQESPSFVGYEEQVLQNKGVWLDPQEVNPEDIAGCIHLGDNGFKEGFVQVQNPEGELLIFQTIVFDW